MSKFSKKSFWVQTHLKHERRRRQSRKALSEYKERYERLWEIYHHLYDNYCEELDGVLSEKQLARFSLLNSEFDGFDKELCALDDFSQSGLNKLATRLKRFALFVLTSAREYGVIPEATKIHYDASRTCLFLDEEEYCYFGR